MNESENTGTAVFSYRIRRFPDGTASTVVIGENTWLGYHHGWVSGGMTSSGVHQSLADPDNPPIMNVLTCPVIEPSDRPRLIAALKDNQAIAVDWSLDDIGTLVLGPPRIQASEDDSPASGHASERIAFGPIPSGSAGYDAAVSGMLRADCFCLSIKSIVEGDPEYDEVTRLDQRGRGATAPIRTRVQPLSLGLGEMSMAWVASYGKSEQAYQDMQNFYKTKTQIRSVLNRAAHTNGFLYATRNVSECAEPWSHCTIPNGGGNPIYFGIEKGSESSYGLIRSVTKATPIFGGDMLKQLGEYLDKSPITVNRKCTGQGDGDVVKLSRTAEGLFESDFTALKGEVVFKQPLPWTVDEQHRVLSAGFKLQQTVASATALASHN